MFVFGLDGVVSMLCAIWFTVRFVVSYHGRSAKLGEFTYTVATARFSIRADFVIKTDQSFCCRRFEFIRFQSAVVV